MPLLFVLAAICVVVWIMRDPILTLAGEALVEDDGATQADVIVVLGGDGYGTRILRAAQLCKDGYAPRVLVSGPPDLLGHESDTTITYATRHGYPASMFESAPLPDWAKSTRTEAEFLGKELQSEGVKKIDLVTSNYHTGRAAWLWRKVNPWLSVNVVPAPDPYFSAGGWFKTREGQKTFLLEWTKTIANHLGD